MVNIMVSKSSVQGLQTEDVVPPGTETLAMRLS